MARLQQSSMLRRALTRISLALILHGTVSNSFLAPTAPIRQQHVSHYHPEYSAASTLISRTTRTPLLSPSSSQPAASVSPTALSVWWFGGTDAADETGVTGEGGNNDSCELVAVRIERPTSNSRKIFGEIVAPVPLEDVWAILTDYERLNIHVPNLVESKIVRRPNMGGGQQGDGTFRCRLFQKGAQKIIGFEFGASVTMDMQEIINSNPSAAAQNVVATPTNGLTLTGHERTIQFKCYDSFFFKNFDGMWKVTERISEDGQVESLLSYIVDVRPKGPVPVAALEWRIREDVPTNLRAVKKAAVEVGRQGVMQARGGSVGVGNTSMTLARSSSNPQSAATSTNNNNNGVNGQGNAPQQLQQQQQIAKRRMAKVKVLWDESETMAAYLKN